MIFLYIVVLINFLRILNFFKTCVIIQWYYYGIFLLLQTKIFKEYFCNAKQVLVNNNYREVCFKKDFNVSFIRKK